MGRQTTKQKQCQEEEDEEFEIQSCERTSYLGDISKRGILSKRGL
jgi:hypothetical protein